METKLQPSHHGIAGGSPKDSFKDDCREIWSCLLGAECGELCMQSLSPLSEAGTYVQNGNMHSPDLQLMQYTGMVFYHDHTTHVISEVGSVYLPVSESRYRQIQHALSCCINLTVHPDTGKLKQGCIGISTWIHVYVSDL